MKQFILSVALIATVAFVGCSKDKEEDKGGSDCVTCTTEAAGKKVETKFCLSGDKITTSVNGGKAVDAPTGGVAAKTYLENLRKTPGCK